MADRIENQVARHYAHGMLEQAILAALAQAGKDIGRLTAADLAPFTEFHIGGREATVEFAAQLDVAPGSHLLEIGSGLGGASQYFAQARGCRVTGIDLSDDYVRTATALAKRIGLDDRVSYRQGSALALPFAPGSFDAAVMLHVGINIADKAALFAAVRHVLKPGGLFGLYDMMREREGPLHFPAPWASSAETSFLETAAIYRRRLEQAGFAIQRERNRRAFALAFFQKVRARNASSDKPAPGLHVVMGPDAALKVANMIEDCERGLIAPTEIICRAV